MVDRPASDMATGSLGDAPAGYVVLGDPRFFERAGPFAIEHLAAASGARLELRETASGAQLRGVAPLQTASADQVAALHNPRYAPAAEATRAGAVIVSARQAARVPATCAVLVADDPHLAWAVIAALFHPEPPDVPGRHPSAVIDPSAEIDASATVGPHAVIGRGAVVGAGCRIGPNAVIGAGVVMGQGCHVGACASISHAILGARVHVHPGARVGQEGFGFAITAGGFVSVPQLGRVILEDDVGIGANSCVDRGASQDTVIGRGSRIDNLIQIGHNCRLGQGCVMAGQSGMAGSCTLEDYAQMGAQAGLAGHLTVGSRARVGAQAGVMSDVPAGSDVIGSPALPIREFFRNVAALRQLARRKPAGAAPSPAEADAGAAGADR